MYRSFRVIPLVVAVAMLTGGLRPARAGAPQKINACTVVTTEEVKKRLPWDPRLDQFPPEETPVGTDGSLCEYPSVGIQVLPPTSRILETAKQRGKAEAVSGIGSEALFYVNPNGYAELYVRASKHVFTLQADAQKGVDKAKPGLLSLAKVLAAKL